MSNDFRITISAIDKATSVIRKINSSMDGVGKNSSFAKIGKGIADISKSSEKAVDGIGLLSLKTVGLVGAGVTVIGALAESWGRLGWEVSRTAATIGISTTDLQSLRGAAQLAGISSSDLTGSLKALGDTMNDAVNGRNQQALVLMSKLGIGLHRTADGAIDTTRALMDFANVLSNPYYKGNAQTRGVVERAFGIGSLDSLLLKGSAAIKEYQDTASSLGAVPGKEAIDRATKFAESIERLTLAIKGLRNAVGDSIIQNIQPIFDKITDQKSSQKEKVLSMFGGIGDSWLKGMFRIAGLNTGDGPLNFFNQKSLPIGMRQNNPGNLRQWGGVPTVNGFANFPSPIAGLSALKKQLELYGARGNNTLRGIVNAYSPSGENNTDSYLRDMAGQTGFGKDQHLSTSDPKTLAMVMNALIRHELGRNPYQAEVAQVTGTQQPVRVDVVVRAEPGTRASAKVNGSGSQEVSGRIGHTMVAP